MGRVMWRFIGVASLFMLPACSETLTPSVQPSTDFSALVQRVASNCTDARVPRLGQGNFCIDSGFTFSRDDFSFANWGRSQKADENITIQTLIDLFGHNSVCLSGDESTCTARPITTQKIIEWNSALAGGRCEGIATLGTRLHMGIDDPSQFNQSPTVNSIRKNNRDLNQALVYWWATQLLPEVANRAEESRLRSPLELVDDLINGFINKDGYTIGMYFNNAGHSVMPFAVTEREKVFVIHVYDNNYPGERREIEIDKALNTWSYNNALQRGDGTFVDWSGGTGSLELTPIASREGPFQCPFCLDIENVKETTLTVSSQDPKNPVYVRLNSRRGTITTASDSISNTIDGSTIETTKNGINGLLTITLPENMGDFDVDFQSDNNVSMTGDAVVTLARPNMASLQIAGNIALQSSMNSDSPVIAARENSTAIQAPLDRIVRVSLAARNQITHSTLRGGTSLLAYRLADNAIEVSLKGSSGKSSSPSRFSMQPSSYVSSSTLSMDDEGAVVVTESRVDAMPVLPKKKQNFTPQPRTTTTIAAEIPSSIVIYEPD
jgi:hypothetical protein